MKEKFWRLGLLMLLSAPFIASCDDDDDNVNIDDRAGQVAQSRYPGAQIREIDTNNRGYEVQMWWNNGEVDMYLDFNYQWLFTEFDILWSDVPQAVVDKFMQEGYTFNTREDDVNRIEYPVNGGTETGTYYSIELDREPTDIYLTYNPDGTRHTAGSTPSPNNPSSGNSEITRIVQEKYPDAQIREIDPVVGGGYEVQMWWNNGEVDMYLDSGYQWLFTEFDIPWSAVPQAVVDSFTREGYTFNTREDDVDRIEYPVNGGTETGTYYRIELDREPTDKILTYNPDGTTRQ